MTRLRSTTPAFPAFTILLLLGVLSPACGRTRAEATTDEALQIIDNPGGGQIVYGALPGESSFGGGMAAMLRSVHGHFGDRPQVGKFFQARGSDSVAAFFTLIAKNQGGKPMAGLVIVSMPQGSRPAAAVLYDEAARFPRTQSALMQKLNEAWPGAASAAAARSTGPALTTTSHQAAPQALRMATAGDRSASIGLPAGWQFTGVSGGQLSAAGPNGELVYLGIIHQQIHDPRSRQYQGVPTAGAKGRSLVCSPGGDLFSAFVSVSNQVRQNRQLPPGTYRLVSSQGLPRTQFEPQVIQAIYEVDLHDGKGLRKGSARIGAMITRGLPTWALTVSGSNAPIGVAEAEAPTILAVIHSYSQDARVIAGETRDVINRIHADAKAAQIRADAQSAANNAHNRAFDTHMDDLSRHSKSFQNYQFDRSQVRDSDLNARGTLSNPIADALVRADPNRYQILRTQDFLKGVDY